MSSRSLFFFPLVKLSGALLLFLIFDSLHCFPFFFFFLGPRVRLMEVPRLGVKSELPLPTHTTATATWDRSHVCDLHHSSKQHWILNPLSEARDWSHNLMVPSQIRFCCPTTGTPVFSFFNSLISALIFISFLLILALCFISFAFLDCIW